MSIDGESLFTKLDALPPNLLERLALITTLLADHPESVDASDHGQDSVLDVFWQALEILPNQPRRRSHPSLVSHVWISQPY